MCRNIQLWAIHLSWLSSRESAALITRWTFFISLLYIGLYSPLSRKRKERTILSGIHECILLSFIFSPVSRKNGKITYPVKDRHYINSCDKYISMYLFFVLFLCSHWHIQLDSQISVICKSILIRCLAAPNR